MKFLKKLCIFTIYGDAIEQEPLVGVMKYTISKELSLGMPGVEKKDVIKYITFTYHLSLNCFPSGKEGELIHSEVFFS